MAYESKEPNGPLKYVISTLQLVCFKIYQKIQHFEFFEFKRNMVILAPNSTGKTGAVDALEYILSEDGTVERIGDEEDKMLNKAGPVALKNAFNENDRFPTSVRAEIEVYDEHKSEKVDSFVIERVVGVSDESKSELHTNFLKALRVSPIIRGEESNSFVTALTPLQRFEKVAIWMRRKSLLDILNQLRETIAKSPTAMAAARKNIIGLDTKLANTTNQKISEWNETAILEYINNEHLTQFEPKLSMSSLTRIDPTYIHLEESYKKLTESSSKVQKNEQQSENLLRSTFEIISLLIGFGEEYSQLNLAKQDIENTIENTKIDAKVIYKEMVSELQKDLDQLHDQMNEYFQYITGNPDKKVYLQIDQDKDTNEGLVHLTTDFKSNLLGVQPSGYLSNAEKHALALAFQFANIRVFNREAKILILDDLVTSIDAGYRNRIVSLIFEKFSDFQIIATTHDDLFFLSMYASADLDNWTFSKIIRVDPDHGPVFDVFRPTIEEMNFLWDHAHSALTLLRQQIEQDFEQLIKDLNIKMRMLKSTMFDSYNLNEKIIAVKDFFSKAGLKVPQLNDVEKQTLDYFAEAKLLNVGIHNREETHSTMSIEDEQKLTKQYDKFKSWLVCKCGHDRFRRIGKIEGKPKMICRDCNTEFSFKNGM